MAVDFKVEIKNRFVGSLKTQKANVRSQISSILAAIACIELPRGEWDELIPTLCAQSKVTEANTDLRHASLQTLGYICEDMEPRHLRDEMKNQIIQVLVTNISEEASAVEITKVAVKALQSSISYATKCFADETDRRFIMEKILSSCAHADEEIKEKEVILGKLLETVKDYSNMKADYERLLGSIGSLESERKQLEYELDKAKKVSDSTPKSSAASAASQVQVERIKERFVKVKEELDKMKSERKVKENAYRSMKKDSQKCEEMSRELGRLKETKTGLIRSHKQATARHMKTIKEHILIFKVK